MLFDSSEVAQSITRCSFNRSISSIFNDMYRCLTQCRWSLGSMVLSGTLRQIMEVYRGSPVGDPVGITRLDLSAISLWSPSGDLCFESPGSDLCLKSPSGDPVVSVLHRMVIYQDDHRQLTYLSQPIHVVWLIWSSTACNTLFSQ